MFGDGPGGDAEVAEESGEGLPGGQGRRRTGVGAAQVEVQPAIAETFLQSVRDMQCEGALADADGAG
ncbi:hypothetical protein STENM223S_08926 [Streptomyces tendae]